MLKMIIKRKETQGEYVSKTSKWHSVFIIFPRLINGYWYFLCRVERMAKWGMDGETFWGCKYRVEQNIKKGK